MNSVRIAARIYGRIENELTIRGMVRFENGVDFIRDFSVLQHLEPYEVIIGRDILNYCRVYLDLGRGHLRIYFPADAPQP